MTAKVVKNKSTTKTSKTNLVIVESPAKAKTIEKFLGKKYKVLASIGHVRDLPKSKMGIEVDNDFSPSYITIRGKGDVIKALKKEAKKADKVFLATDPDREGEAIAWHLAFLLGISSEENCRVTFHEITKTAVKEAIKNPVKINQDLVDAQQARRVLDRLVGYSISPILWAKIRRGLSAGRVQSVATKMICDREDEINAFIPEEYWEIDALLHKEGSKRNKFEAKVFMKQDEKIKISTKQEAQKIVSDIEKLPFVIESVVHKEKLRQPYLCFTTSSLQQEASNKLGFSTKKTMMVAQQLYEGISIKGQGTLGLITYMRTDSTRISDESKYYLTEYIKQNFGENYLADKFKVVKNSKSAQDAHEAIRPTSVLRQPTDIMGSLTKDQYKLYKLIWERFVAYGMKPAKFDSLTVLTRAGEYLLKSSGTQLMFDGFLKVYSFATTKDKMLPELVEKETVVLSDISPLQHFTQPPSRYTEATLVREMEEKGIGRPSTYSPTITTIISRGYVDRVKKVLYPTELGFLINDIMKNNFQDIVNVDFTANMELKFDKIADSETSWKAVIRDFYNPFVELIENANKSIEKVDLTETTDIPCDKCGEMMNIKHGRFGKFLACSNYPDCDFTKAILKTIGIKCPICKDGDVVERKTKKFKNFYGCSKFPECNFVNWNKPTGKNCPECGNYLVEQKTRQKHVIKCSDKDCKYQENVSKK